MVGGGWVGKKPTYPICPFPFPGILRTKKIKQPKQVLSLYMYQLSMGSVCLFLFKMQTCHFCFILCPNALKKKEEEKKNTIVKMGLVSPALHHIHTWNVFSGRRSRLFSRIASASIGRGPVPSNAPSRGRTRLFFPSFSGRPSNQAGYGPCCLETVYLYITQERSLLCVMAACLFFLTEVRIADVVLVASWCVELWSKSAYRSSRVSSWLEIPGPV